MPRYFFHIDDGVFLPDDEGTELANLGAAKAQAIVAAGEFLTERDGDFWERSQAWRMQVTDENNRLLFALHFSADLPSGEVYFRPVVHE